MIARLRRAATARDGISLLERTYLVVIMASWVFLPEVRRLIDWQAGAAKLSIVTLMPLVLLLPLLVPICRRGFGALAREFRVALVFWFGAFIYAYIVGFFSGGILPATFQATNFIAPVFVGIWIATSPRAGDAAYRQLAWTALWLGAVVGAYGVVQYVYPPPWDVAWVNDSGLHSIGTAEPFGLRIFSTLNAPQVLGDFLSFAIIAVLPLVMRRNIKWLIGPFLFIASALALTGVRSAWIATAIALLLYIVLSPRRGNLLAPGVVIALLCGITFVAITATDRSVTERISERFSTLSDLQNDSSAQDRQMETSTALDESLTEPLGQGLGNLGTSTKLTSSETTTTLDNGYLSRFLEMGVVGVTGYLVTVFLLFGATVRRTYIAARTDADHAAVLAACSAIQIFLIVLDVASDHHMAITGVFFWAVVAIALREPQPAFAVSRKVVPRRFGGGPRTVNTLTT